MLEGFNSRLHEVEEWISGLENRTMELTHTEQQNEKQILKSEDTLRDLWYTIKQNNIWTIGVSEGGEREQGLEKLFEEIVAENSPIWGKETDRSRKPRESEEDEPKEMHTKTHYN